jgi:hypothetical protein
MIKLGVSDFARKFNSPQSGRAYCTKGWEHVVAQVQENWAVRIPGSGEYTTDRKCLVPVDPSSFVGSSIPIAEDLVLSSKVERRQDGEDLYIRTTAVAKDHRGIQKELEIPAPKYVNIVVYSAEALLENGGERSTKDDWEIVTVIASDVPSEPMTPLTMARNYLEEPGGTFTDYTAEEFARAIIYWSKRVPVNKQDGN